jgi:hypothetical protein
MAPHLSDGVYVFCTFSTGELPHGLKPICTFAESEGLTAIIEKKEAQQLGLPIALEMRMITLTVHSALEAVGFIAAVSGRLALEGIPCNVVSAYYHDHLFVPARFANRAMEVLASLSASGTGN